MTLKSKPSSEILGYRDELHSCVQSLALNSQNGSQCAALGAKAPIGIMGRSQHQRASS